MNPNQIVTDERLRQWAETHNMDGWCLTDLRCAYENAASGPYAQSLILSAAAKMVKESGAVEALEDAQSDIPAIKERTGWKFAGREMAYAKALAYLRSLSEQEKTQ